MQAPLPWLLDETHSMHKVKDIFLPLFFEYPVCHLQIWLSFGLRVVSELDAIK